MKRWIWGTIGATAAAMIGTPAGASGDYGCTQAWRLLRSDGMEGREALC